VICVRSLASFTKRALVRLQGLLVSENAMNRLVLALILVVSLTAPAAADVPPPRLQRAHALTLVPKGIRNTLDELVAAMKQGDAAKAELQVDPRGWHTNLVGGSGQALADTVHEGTSDGWWLRIVPDSMVVLSSKAYVLTCDVVRTKDGRVVDGVDVLFVSIEGAWKILGAGEKHVQVVALGQRFLQGTPLAPAPERE